MCRTGRSWIGLYKFSSSSTDPAPSAQYWLDGSTSTFRRWDTFQPDNANTFCVAMMTLDGNFDDEDCGIANGFVCKRNAGISP